jgi:hypothetical protein
MKHAFILSLLVVCPSALVAQQQPDQSQSAGHAAMHASPATSATMPTLAGQDAYAAIGEIVRLLEADPATDWSKVDIETLRQHLIDMNVVTLQSRVEEHPVAAGIDMTITGGGRTEAAIRRMVTAHGPQLRALGLAATSEPVPGGIHFVVTAVDAADRKLVAKVQGLGFIGIMTLGAHHPEHHLALARGMAMAGH